MRIVIAVFALAASLASANACKDLWPSTVCIRNVRFCFADIFQKYCPKTCSVCTGPATAAPPRPVPTTSGRGTPGPQPSCGRPAVQQGRVIGGHDAKPGAWPWQIAMFMNGHFGCGGSLVTPEWVVTAAHCVERDTNPGRYKILLGAQDLREREASWQMRDVQRIIVHPGYRYMNNDLALIQLAKPAVLNDRVKTVCLPQPGDAVPVGTKCFITGFGKIKHPGRSHPILQQTDLPVVSQSTCANLNTKVTRIPIRPQMVCAGYGPGNIKSGCHGDSGGPFVCQYGNGDAFTLHGAVSWGSAQCNTRDSYSVFARISALRSWIDQYIQI